MTAVADPAALTLDQPRDQNAASRARLYALFAEALSFPEGSVALRLLDGDLLAELREQLDCLKLDIECPTELPLPAGPDAIRELQRIYSALFDVAGGIPAISLLERRYGEVPEQKLWDTLLAFYTHFGLDFSSGYAAEQPDHLLTELGFIHYLCFLEAGAARGVDDLRRGQRDFLRMHLARWTAALTAKISDSAHHPVYVSLLETMARFVSADLERLDEMIDREVE